MLTNLTLKTGTLTDNYQAQKRMQMPNWETVMRRFIVALLFSTFFTTPASADFSDAMSAFEAGRYVTAAREFRRLAQQGDADAQFMLGYAYALGEGVLQDYVQAHMWFNLAAAAGKSEARGSRSGIERKMTPLQIAEAQRLARGWRPTTPAEAPRTTELARAKPDEVVVPRETVHRETIRDIQAILTKLGYKPGSADGVMGRNTHSAIRSYQKDTGLPIDGEPSESLRADLEKDLEQLAVKPTGREIGWAKDGQDPQVMEFLDRLRTLVQKAEANRAADRGFLANLYDLIERHDWPWRRTLLDDTFQDGDYTHNPPWKVVAGQFSVIPGWGLRTTFSAPSRQTRDRDNGKSSQDLSLTILEALLQGKRHKKRKEADTPRLDYTEIRVKKKITNAFVVRMKFRSQESRGSLEFGPYQDKKRGTGYRLIYNPGKTPGLELIRRNRSGTSVIEVTNKRFNLEDRQFHTIQWKRDLSGKMAVELDGEQIFQVTDRGFNDPFNGFSILNRGGDYGINQITIFGTGQKK